MIAAACAIAVFGVRVASFAERVGPPTVGSGSSVLPPVVDPVPVAAVATTVHHLSVVAGAVAAALGCCMAAFAAVRLCAYLVGGRLFGRR